MTDEDHKIQEVAARLTPCTGEPDGHRLDFPNTDQHVYLVYCMRCPYRVFRYPADKYISEMSQYQK